MHSPRIRVPSQSAKATMYKSWAGAKPPKSSTSKPLQDEIEKFKILARQCEEENKRLLETLSAFNSVNESINSQTFLIDQFENELNQFSKRIDKRAILIDSIEKKSCRRKEAEFRNQDIFQEKTQLINENEQLVSKALFLEKKMIAAKLKLKLNHDHRDFCRIKRQLARLNDNDEDTNDEEMEIYRNKEIIKNLKNAIEHEKSRLLRVNAPPSLEEEAAEIIQKVWRGYMVRKSLAESNKNQNTKSDKENISKADDPPFSELDNSEKNNEENNDQINNQVNNEENNDQINNEEISAQENDVQINNEENNIQTNNEENNDQTNNEEIINQVDNEENNDQINNEENNGQINNEEKNDQINNEEINNQVNNEENDVQAKNDENDDQIDQGENEN